MPKIKRSPDDRHILKSTQKINIVVSTFTDVFVNQQMVNVRWREKKKGALEVKGTVMGTSMGPSYVNLFMVSLEDYLKSENSKPDL